MRRLPVLVGLVVASFSAPVMAQNFVGLNTGGITLTTFGTDGVTGPVIPVTGLSLGDTLIDIDYFTSGSGELFGMGASGTLYTLSIGGATATATVNVGPVYTPGVSGGPTSLGTPTAIDFNPAADRLRVFSGTSNWRVSPAPGMNAGLLTNDGMFSPGGSNLVAAAYTSNFDNPPAMPGTILYSIDAGTDSLIKHVNGPAFSTLETQGLLQVGGVGAAVDFGAGTTGFDILTVSSVDTAYLSNANTLYTVNLNGGVAGGVAGDLTFLATLSGLGAVPGVTDIAVVPEPATLALMLSGLSIAAVVLYRRRLRKSQLCPVTR